MPNMSCTVHYSFRESIARPYTKADDEPLFIRIYWFDLVGRMRGVHNVNITYTHPIYRVLYRRPYTR